MIIDTSFSKYFLMLSPLRKVFELQSGKKIGFYFIDNQTFPFRVQGKKRLIIKF